MTERGDVPGDPAFESGAQRLRDVLRDAFPTAEGRPDPDPERLAFPPVREFARDAVDRAFAARAVDFPSGRLTVCALRPLRTVPFRIVCVAGLADCAFPRSDRELPFDLIRADRRPGDRSTRADDRLLFLETLLA
ncbi:MAG: exodeoxyribonuclease V subunit gamma, partial [Kamptonema sp. SIO4C4]|nr:exodeoxyribonuclease V subunit gamma [Kamptonema sp. SIO4C4]